MTTEAAAGVADLGAMYREARVRVCALVDDTVADVPVPATPAWTVHDVISHLAGIAEDVEAGNMEGATTDPWTAAQVARGQHKSVATLTAEWSARAPLLEGFLSTPEGASAFRAVFDIHTHEADLRNALDLPVEMPAAFLDWAVPLMLAGFHDAVATRGLPPIEVAAPALEVMRSRLGRRTVDETRALSWSADPTDHLDVWFIFGRAERSLGER